MLLCFNWQWQFKFFRVSTLLDMWSLKGMNCWENYRSRKNLLRFYVNMPSLNKLIEYIDCKSLLPCKVNVVSSASRLIFISLQFTCMPFMFLFFTIFQWLIFQLKEWKGKGTRGNPGLLHFWFWKKEFPAHCSWHNFLHCSAYTLSTLQSLEWNWSSWEF